MTAVVEAAPETDRHEEARVASWWMRWLPLGVALLAAASLLIRAGTSPLDLLRYAAYAVFAVGLPGTLVYRSMRRTPHTFVEDAAMGLAVGLVLELVGWACFAALHLQTWMILWPLAVLVPFAALPRLRRHWRPTGYTRVPLGWAWAVAAVVVGWSVYLHQVFLERNPIIPTSDSTLQYTDLSYQQSLAANAKSHFPIQFPQVAGEPLYYHWFGYVHMASISLIGHIDLPVVTLRLAVPGLCALAIVLTAVVGWRISGRPYVGAGAAVLFWTIGEVDFQNPSVQLFGTQATFVVWHGMSMTYSWVLLIAVIAPLGELVGRTAGTRVPALGRGVYPLLALLAFASGGAKASSLPVMLLALLFAGGVMLLVRRRVPWPVVGGVLILVAAEVFALLVIFRLHTYGLAIDPLFDLRPYWKPVDPRPAWEQALVVLGVFAAFFINMESRGTGILALLKIRRFRLEPIQLLLLGGGLAGLALYWTYGTVNDEYFTRSAFPFVVLLSAWGWALVLDRARPSRRFLTALGVGAAVFAGVLTLIVLVAAPTSLDVNVSRHQTAFHHLTPLLRWAGAFLVLGLVVAALWRPMAARWPALRGRGGAVALTAALVFGAPGLVMDIHKSRAVPNGGPYATVPMPRSRVLAARWVRDHSAADEVIATNDHCVNADGGQITALNGDTCDVRSFWLSAYSERTVLVEGWGFAPRQETDGVFFWNMPLLTFNDSLFTAPTPALASEMRQRYHVRFLVADRLSGPVSAALLTVADQVYTNAEVTVYELRPA